MHSLLDSGEQMFFNGSGCPEPMVEPEWDRIDRNVFDDRDIRLDDVREEEREKAVRLFVRLKSWDFGNGMADPQGLMIRAAVSSWAVVPLLRPLTLTKLAIGLGLKKQSLGRWVDHFKRRFPEIRNSHMRE